jgi:DNA (cytosine-5)-methyltransferase 1
MKLTHIDLFSGIGGFALAARWAGIETVQFVEIDKFCQKVLKKHWPGVPIHDDITTFDGTKYSNVFLLTGGFPCQPFSCAGKRRGKEDDRYLWPEMLRIIQEVRPRWIIGENVDGFINMGLDDSISDLEREGYSVQAFVLPACAVNAPHRRDRVWIVANSTSGRCFNGCGDREERHFQDSSIRTVEENKSERNRRLNRIKQTDSHAPDTSNQGLQGCEETGNTSINGEESRNEQLGRCTDWQEPWIEAATRLCRVDDGLPRQVDRVNRLKALGNAVVPQIPFLIMTGILDLYIVGQPLP